MIDIFTADSLKKTHGLSCWVFAVQRHSNGHTSLLRTFVHEEDAKTFVHECKTLTKYPCEFEIEKVLLRF